MDDFSYTRLIHASMSSSENEVIYYSQCNNDTSIAVVKRIMSRRLDMKIAGLNCPTGDLIPHLVAL